MRASAIHSIKGSWNKILALYKANTSKSSFNLSAGASEKEIADLESLIGMELPKDVKESYRLYNGTTDLGGVFSYGYYLLSIEEISKAWRMWEKGVKKGVFNGMEDMIEAKGPIKRIWWDVRWIPITADGGDDYRCVDMDPAKGGTVGQIIYFNHEAGPIRVEASSWREYLSNFADGLENGRFRFVEREGMVLPKK